MPRFDNLADYDPLEEDRKGALGNESGEANTHDLRLFLHDRGIYPIPDKTFGYGSPNDKSRTAEILARIDAPQKIRDALMRVT